MTKLFDFISHYWMRIKQELTYRYYRIGARKQSLQVFETAPLKKVLVLCYGNIYRSALVGHLLKETHFDTSVEIRSAGFYFKAGRPSPETYVEFLNTQNIDLSDHRSTVVTSEMLDWADTVLIMDARNFGMVRQMNPAAVKKVIWLGALVDSAGIDIDDPYGRDREMMQMIVQTLLNASELLIRAINSR